jgi:BMFP domain-containing protein YqiC
MKRLLLIVLALVALATPAFAQPARFGDAAQALYAGAHLTATSSDDAKRAVTIQLAEQMAFEFPGQGWGAKTAGNGRPISKDCVAKVESLTGGTSIVKGVCYDWIKGGGGVQLPPLANDIAGQVFVPVAAVDHLAVSTPPPPPPAPPATAGVTQEQLAAAITDLHSTLWHEVEATTGAEVDALRDALLQAKADLAATAKRVSALEAKSTPPPTTTPVPPEGGSTPPPASDVAADVKRIRELLEQLVAAAKRFGLQ